MPQPAVVLTPAQFEQPDISQPRGWNDFARHYLAEGDSWFTLAALPGGNLLQELDLRHSTLIINTAFPGDTLSHIVDWRRNRPFVNLLSRRNFAHKWDAVLLSAGGNDIIDAALSPEGILRPPQAANPGVADCIEPTNLEKFERYLAANMRSVVDLRDDPQSPNKGIPIYIHTYDYPTARPAPARLLGTAGLSGPWLHRAYTSHRIPENLWIPLTDHLIDALARRLLGLDLPNLRVIDTRGTLDRAGVGATGDSGDWLNEIHANRGGRKKLAKKWAVELDRIGA